MRRVTISFLTAVYACILAMAGYAADAVKWDIKLVGDGTDSPSIVMSATIDPGYHLYSIDNPAGGSNPLVFFFDTKGCETVGTPTADHPYTKEFDDTFEVDQHFYANKVTFTQKLKPTAPDYSVDVEIKGQACNDTGCSQVYGGKSLSGKAPVKSVSELPEPKDAAEAATVEEKAEAIAEEVDSLHKADGPLVPGALTQGDVTKAGWWTNVEAELRAFEADAPEATSSLLYIFIAGFLGGLIALVTPCVWPMIPMTVSFFLKQNKKSRKKAIGSAATYGASIIVIYVVLGLAVTIIFGASALNNLATNAIFNIIFFLLLFVFAISLMGAFELTLLSI